MRSFATAAPFAFVVLLSLAVPSVAAQEDCDFIAASYAKLVNVPYKQIIKTDGKVGGEFISMNNMLYAKVSDSWDSMPYALEARRANMNQLFDKLSIKECAREPDGNLEGKAVKVFSYVVPPITGMSTEPTTQLIHIGSDDGMPYLMTAGAMWVELSYDNVAAPIE